MEIFFWLLFFFFQPVAFNSLLSKIKKGKFLWLLVSGAQMENCVSGKINTKELYILWTPGIQVL